MSGHYICDDCGYDGGEHANYCKYLRPVNEQWKGNRKMILNHQFSNSSMFASATYDTEAKELTVEFNNGRSYVYEYVDTDTYNALIGAKSAGGYFNSIKKDLKVKK